MMLETDCTQRNFNNGHFIKDAKRRTITSSFYILLGFDLRDQLGHRTPNSTNNYSLHLTVKMFEKTAAAFGHHIYARAEDLGIRRGKW